MNDLLCTRLAIFYLGGCVSWILIANCNYCLHLYLKCCVNLATTVVIKWQDLAAILHKVVEQMYVIIWTLPKDFLLLMIAVVQCSIIFIVEFFSDNFLSIYSLTLPIWKGTLLSLSFSSIIVSEILELFKGFSKLLM